MRHAKYLPVLSLPPFIPNQVQWCLTTSKYPLPPSKASILYDFCIPSGKSTSFSQSRKKHCQSRFLRSEYTTALACFPKKWALVHKKSFSWQTIRKQKHISYQISPRPAHIRLGDFLQLSQLSLSWNYAIEYMQRNFC